MLMGAAIVRAGETIALDLLDRKDDVLMDFLVHGKLAGLSEGSSAAWVVTFEWFLLCVNIHVLFEILCQRKRLEAQYADMLLSGGVGCDVSPEGEARGVSLITAWHLAFVWSFHLDFVRVFSYKYF